MSMITQKQPLDRHETVSFCLRQCALVIDPRFGHLSALAGYLDLHPNTFLLWINNGRVPAKAAKRLQRIFGKKLANAEQLIG